jgi:hypothetical protein
MPHEKNQQQTNADPLEFFGSAGGKKFKIKIKICLKSDCGSLIIRTANISCFAVRPHNPFRRVFLLAIEQGTPFFSGLFHTVNIN